MGPQTRHGLHYPVQEYFRWVAAFLGKSFRFRTIIFNPFVGFTVTATSGSTTCSGAKSS